MNPPASTELSVIRVGIIPVEPEEATSRPTELFAILLEFINSSPSTTIGNRSPTAINPIQKRLLNSPDNREETDWAADSLEELVIKNIVKKKEYFGN
ncbi:hypothetical protein CVD25_08620 [Bacillus canaveralius]|uniref:Uncharacterized protein n=1 Tax=Bacillus canaveralius TaxID=1403243 RepID=A0A2N5GL14_9BACI|nr:hypothetical protein [Bacillus canaveralius]PLR82213.1 hypothetical protein CU635_13720 [Bacillus canaveralius]PLR97881.1 hypothetical protein CVD25_08620 [Bacillus canaveralius]